MKNAVFWMLCHAVIVRTVVSEEFLFLCSVHRLANGVPSSPILVAQIMEALISPETSVLPRPTQHKIPEDEIIHSPGRQNLKSYMICFLLFRIPDDGQSSELQ
jgi:hypothetical protein